MKTLIWAIFVLVVAGCSGKQDSSSAGIQVFAGKLAISSATGGAMLWGRDRSGNNSFGEQLTGPNFEIELPNGIWDFYVIAWEGPEAMSGTPHCAGALGVELKGEAVNVALQTANNKCGLAPFNAHTFINEGLFEFPQVKIKTCNEKSALNSTGCSTTDDQQGYVSSYNFIMPSYTKFAGTTAINEANSLKKTCSVVGPESMKMVAYLGNLPLFGPNLPFLSILRAHLGSDDCNQYATGSGHIDRTLNSGLPLSSVPKMNIEVTGLGPYLATFAHQFTEADICQGSRLTTSPSEAFAGGMGTSDMPNLICTKAQLAKISNEWAVNSGRSFWLLRDLTLDRLIPPLASIGDPYPGTVATPYSGVFNGRGHSISNYYLNVETVGYADDVGFIRSLTGTVKNLKLLNAEILCNDNSTKCNNVGILAGTSHGNLENITVTGRVVGRSYVGGMIGNASSGAGNNKLHAKVNIESRSSYTGGLIGRSYVDLSNSSAEVRIHSKQNHVGGLIGDQVVGTISTSTSTGSITGDSIVGGLVGNLTNSAAISNSYSTANVHAQNDMSSPSLAAGGLVGLCDGAITNSFATEGSITVNQNGSPDDFMAAVGGLVGEKGGSANVTDSFFTGPNNLITQQFGTAFTAGKGLGTLLAIGNSAGQLYDSDAYTSWVFWDGLSATQPWYMPDDGYDYPRLSWEVEIGSELPHYLKRDCSGKFLVTTGSATAADPRWICTQAQFEAMGTSLHYALKRNIDYGNASKFGKIFTPGIYKLNGNGHSLNNIWILPTVSGHNAIFQDLQTGSYLKNLRIIGSKIHASSYGNPSDQASAALLAGINSGLIENITVQKSKVQIDALNTGGTITDLWFSGLVTKNLGTMRKIRTDMEMNFRDVNLTANAGDRLWVAGLVHQNEGIIDIVRANTMISYISSAAGYDPNATKFQISGLFSHNTSSSVISEVQADNSFYLEGMTSGGATLSGLINSNDGTIRDVSLEASFIQNSIVTDSNISGVVDNNLNGTIERLVNLGSDGNSDYSYGVNSIDSISLTSTGTFIDVHCLADNESSTGGFDDGNNFIDCLDLSNTDPNFVISQNSPFSIIVNYDTDIPSTEILNISGFTFTDDPNHPSAIWLLNGDEAPVIRRTRFIGNF